MKVLLLHPEDSRPPAKSPGQWDLIVDFGHASPATHQAWGREMGCRVLSIFDFAEDIQDLYLTRELLQSATGRLVDRFGIDWWDVLSVAITPGILQLQMIRRLAEEVDQGELYMSRPIPGVRALACIVGRPLHDLESRAHSTLRRFQRYWHVMSRFDPALTLQIFQDKFDSTHWLRSKLVRRRRGVRRPVVLLPSAYLNVSRTEVAYAAGAPEDRFLLVYARAIARVEPLPPNVQTASLDAYVARADEAETASLGESWSHLKRLLVAERSEFAAAEAAGILGQVTALLPWGVAIRDGWIRVLDAENVIACVSADDGNPYSRLPLILAKQRGIPTLACHHGALDRAMAIKTNHADFYLAKTELERDYLLNVCRVEPEVIVPLAPPGSRPALLGPTAAPEEKTCLVFFTETSTSPWRGEELYRDLMPAVAVLARACGLKLVFKIHPFENKGDYEGWVKDYLPGESGREVEVIAGSPSELLWKKTRFALTVQSSLALECCARGIPVFLLAWLREPHCGYLEQYARFGVGQVIESPAQLAEIPRLLESQSSRCSRRGIELTGMNPVTLHDLVHGTHAYPTALKAQTTGD